MFQVVISQLNVVVAEDYTPIYNLAEVKLFYQGVQLPPASLSFVFSSTYTIYSASNCNDGDLTDVCHTGTNDLNPTLTITGTGSVDSVVVYNRADCCQYRILGAVITVANAGVPDWYGFFTGIRLMYNFNTQGKP